VGVLLDEGVVGEWRQGDSSNHTRAGERQRTQAYTAPTPRVPGTRGGSVRSTPNRAETTKEDAKRGLRSRVDKRDKP
jgi:hypothetical protein